MSRVVRVAVLQLRSELGAVAANVERAATMIRDAAAQGAQLVCLPEMATTGYFCQPDAPDDVARFDWAEPADGPSVTLVRDLAADLGVTVVLPWFERAAAGVYYNSAAVIDSRGALLGAYRKTHTAFSPTAAEKFYVRPGGDFPVFDTPFGRLGVLICYDRDFPEAARILSLRGAELLCVPTAASPRLGSLWEAIWRTRAYENQVAVVAAGAVGAITPGHDGFHGHSLVVDPTGEVLASLAREETTLIADVDLDKVEAARRRRFMLRDRRPELYGDLGRDLA